MSDETIFVINPLSSTLRHYEGELIDTLRLAGYDRVELIPTRQGEGVTNTVQRLRIAIASLVERTRLGFSMRGRIVIVVWPLFGYLDPLTLWGLCRANRVLFVMHDPTPLGRSNGHSSASRRMFKWIVNATNTQVIYHTALAQRTGLEMCGIAGAVVPHPVGASSKNPPPMPAPPEVQSTIRVLGQYKRTRAIAPLEDIATQGADRLRLEIHGRGWPSIEGWAIADRFVPESEFDELIQSSDCVVIPYDLFFQSGVAVRSLEHGVRVVAPRHEHIVELYGADWPGLVRNENDWHTAVSRALAADPHHLSARAGQVRAKIGHAWSEILAR